MRVSTRVLVSLLPTVAVIMSVYGGWALNEREDTLVAEAQRETHAYASALARAFETGLRSVDRAQIQGVIDQVSREPTVYGIIVYDSTGRRLFTSDPMHAPGSADPADLHRVFRTGRPVALQREIDDQPVFSVLRAIRSPNGRVSGAIEVAQPLAPVDAAKALVRRRYLLNTLTLLAAVTLVTLWLVGRNVGKPLKTFAKAVRAVGRGELGHRIPDAEGTGELAELAREFNAMSDNLATARTALLKQAEERVALERRLRESEKLAAIGTLATGVAHDIAAPLNVIAGRAEMLRRREVEPAERERFLRIITQQTGRITTIVRSLLNFARRRQAQVVPVDVAAVVDGVAESFEPDLARAGVALERAEPRPLVALGDPDLLHQVLANLVLNALQALDAAEERRIVVRGGRVSAAGGDLVHVDVSDTGPGVPVELREQVFSPFFTTKPRGTGLGLSLARTMVEEQGGRIELLSNGARGATFRVSLPAAAAHG